MAKKRKLSSNLAGVAVGLGFPVRLMGVINVSPESFFKSSVPDSERALVRHAIRIEKEGADFIDVGAMSTAPYLKTEISEREEARRLRRAVRLIRDVSSLPISIDTSRSGPAEAGLESGAEILNDITGLHRDPRLATLARNFQGVILMAHPKSSKRRLWTSPSIGIKTILQKSLKKARNAGIQNSRIVLDPGIGFFRETGHPWWAWDITVLNELESLSELGFPLLVGVSRKSFIGHLLGRVPPEKRLTGSLAATAMAVLNGASLIRTHDIGPTRETIRVIESIR